MSDQPTGYPATLEIDYPDRDLDRLTSFFRPITVIPEARAAVALGDTAAGIRAYDWYLSLREHAEGPWRPEADSAKAELARLVAR